MGARVPYAAITPRQDLRLWQVTYGRQDFRRAREVV
jgi:hypothetical protein